MGLGMSFSSIDAGRISRFVPVNGDGQPLADEWLADLQFTGRGQDFRIGKLWAWLDSYGLFWFKRVANQDVYESPWRPSPGDPIRVGLAGAEQIVPQRWAEQVADTESGLIASLWEAVSSCADSEDGIRRQLGRSDEDFELFARGYQRGTWIDRFGLESVRAIMNAGLEGILAALDSLPPYIPPVYFPGGRIDRAMSGPHYARQEERKRLCRQAFEAATAEAIRPRLSGWRKLWKG